MRNRTVGINIRVTVTEKKKVTMLAKKCGLSLSEYLRQRALGYEPGGHPSKEVFDVLDKLDDIAESCSCLLYTSCRGDHWSPADLAQQRVFPERFFTDKRARASNARPYKSFLTN